MKKKLLATLLAVSMVTGLCACGSTPATSESETDKTVATESQSVAETEVIETSGVTFPLEEEMTFTFMVSSTDSDYPDKVWNSDFMQRMYEETNVKIEYIMIPSDAKIGTINALFAAKNEGDAIFGANTVSDIELTQLASQGFVIPLNEYIDNVELMPNFNENVLGDSPATKGFITTPDGNIYAMPKYSALEGNYLESPFWINKTWVEKAGWKVEDIKTLDDLRTVLTYFAENDMNGNGNTTDEIPYLFRNGHSLSHMEAFLGLYGMATKDSANDHYVYVQDGVVNFAPTAEAYKEAIKTLNDWYENGLLWSEAFVANNDSYSSKLEGELPVVGMYTAKEAPIAGKEEYVQLAPVAVEGYEAEWYRHPGRLGGKGAFSITRSCENPEVLMAWIDKFYSLENTIELFYGKEEDGRYEVVDGKYNFITLSADEKEKIKEEAPVLADFNSSIPSAMTSKDYEDSIVLSEVQKIYQDNYAIYKDYMTDEYWPRPYYAEEDSVRLGELRTDIFNTVALKKAEWVTGVSDIDADWDEYVASLEKMGLDEFISILQETYDVYTEGMK